MLSPNNRRYNQIAFALEVLKLLAEKPRKREELADLLAVFLDKYDKSPGDIPQKLTRTIRQLRDCGFEIESAPHRPYSLVESNFPVLLSSQQQQALYMAAYFLADMGFSEQAGQIIRIGNLSQTVPNLDVKANFSPPVDYSENELSDTIQQLQKRLEQKHRFVIRYCDSRGDEQNWDLDYSELRLHSGVLYLLAFVPDAPSFKIEKQPNAEQNRLFRIDRIKAVLPASDTRWFWQDFPRLSIRYRMTGVLANYQPRRDDETVIERNCEAQSRYVDIETREVYPFWFRQRLLKYGANAQVLSPVWLREQLREESHQMYLNYI